MSHIPARDETPDEALVAAYRAGDDSAFALLFERYRDRVTGYALRMTRRREEADEVCLEAFTRVLEGAWRPTGSFRSFLFTVVHRLSVDHLRRRGRADADPERIDRAAAGDSSPEEHAVDAEEKARLERAIDALPEAHRAVVLLYYGQELPSKDVAEILECDDQQVRSRLSYARRLLREALEGGGKP